MRASFIAFLFAAFVTLGPQPAPAGDDLRSGVNRVNLAWRTAAEQQEILGEIAASGVTDIRLSLSRPVDRSIDALKIADALGLNILLEIQLSNKSYYPSDLKPRTGHDRVWDIHRLSDLDLEKYRTELSSALTRIDEAGIRLEAVEPGNEINISPYNGDLHVYPVRGVRTARSIDELRNRSAFEKGLDKYVDALRIARDLLDATVHSRETKLVSSGLSDMRAQTADRLGLERLDAGEVIDLLQERGLDEIVDAYGIHIYPGNRTASAIERRIGELLEFCLPAETGHPCWITEWGVANTSQECPVDDGKREVVVRNVLQTFDDLSDTGRLEAVFYYDWDSHDRYSVWRCGGLSPAGALAVGLEEK